MKLSHKEWLDSQYDIFARHLLQLEEFGHHDPEKYLVMLYDYKITGKDLKRLHDYIEQVTTRYKYTVLSPGQQYSNILIEYMP